MKRLYENILLQHYQTGDEAIFLCGPRQVGKTTIAAHLQKYYTLSTYLTWDSPSDRRKILEERIPFLETNNLEKPLVILDEIHKYQDWKNLLKAIIDKHKHHINFLVTGSSRLNVYRRGGDSLMGRYFLYNVHPFSVAEIVHGDGEWNEEIRPPKEISQEAWNNLLLFGGFPRPFLAGDQRTFHRWSRQRLERLLQEEIRELVQIHQIKQMEMMCLMLTEQAGNLVSYTSLANSIRVSDQTVRKWMGTLDEFYYCFTLQPWFQNVSRSLVKNPKAYLHDWSAITDKGRRYENFIAVHLLKAVHFWTDCGFGHFQLHYLRDRDQREVDFLITRDHKPWILLEVKSSPSEPLSQNLLHFQAQLNAPHVFQVAMEAPYVDYNCFTINKPVTVPAKTFLSQLA